MQNRIFSGAPTEAKAGYARAVIDGDLIWHSGTIGFDPETGALPPDLESQLVNIFRIIESSLSEAGARLADVKHCRVYITGMDGFETVAAMLRAKLGDVRPANTTVISALVVPGALVEIEVVARR